MEQYIKLNLVNKNRQLLLDYAKSNNSKWFHKNAFDFLLVSDNLLDTELLALKYKFNTIPLIFKMHPWQFYRFHTDEKRSCAINSLLEGNDSNTYYGKNTNDEEVLTIKEINYELDFYYLINTQIKHCVINRNNTRYMFSMGFASTLSYDKIKEFCQQTKIL